MERPILPEPQGFASQVDAWRITAAWHRRAAPAFAVLPALAIAPMIVRVWWRFGSDTFFGDWLHDGVLLGCAVLVAWRGLALPRDRAAWLLIGLGLASWTAAT